MPPVVDGSVGPTDANGSPCLGIDAPGIATPGIIQISNGSNSLVIFPQEAGAGPRRGVWFRNQDIVWFY